MQKKSPQKKLWWIVLVVGTIAIALFSIFNRGGKDAPSNTGSDATDTLLVQKPKVEERKFGIPITKFNVVEGEVRRGAVFSDLLLDYNISWEQILVAADSCKKVFPVTKIKAGNAYSVFTYLKDSIETAAYFLYQIDKTDFLRISLKDSTNAKIFSLPVETTLRSGNVKITSNLYDAFKEKDLPVGLALKLSDIYAWTLDFYRLNKNDEFSFLFEERKAEGKSIGVGRVLAAEYRSGNDTLDAFRFYHSALDMDQFFDHKGENLQKSMLKSPVKFGRISSRYSLRRFHPVQKRYKAHLGTDYAAPHGTPILAVGDGVVLEAKYSKYNGRYVKIKHNSTYTSQYLHMSKYGSGIKAGVRVKQGQIIGYVGATGLATGPHVCLRLWKYGKQVDHLREKFSPADPIPATDLPVFQDSVRVLKQYLSGFQDA
ncbi:peptidoglycan DD-metalloendopeptidase family protein [Luteibaculum oceani]|uniref:Peptidoglycan DD-metalloendopeptidase family protein n=1 Tax=Luteibaculum oceani TaxID=1294296 RepID=A0A5C6VL55_9FLAO|nr:peptidoglycan DD-metalloendopeptidase family protein [Luteibaculum oceani]TXC85086.1 peptidoglycan DD-metalloendopeptidase family protein [Luteibaculum oceani]